jgi:hypothetical protein
VAVVTEDSSADRTGDKANRVDGKRLQRANQWIGRGEIQLREDQAGYLAVQQEIVLLDGRTDRAGADGPTKLRVMVCLRQGARHDARCRHGGTSLKTVIFSDFRRRY